MNHDDTLAIHMSAIKYRVHLSMHYDLVVHAEDIPFQPNGKP